MAERAELPEEIIVNIFTRLPVKSLIRFTCVSKRLHFIILFDPKFAQSHFEAARRSRRLLTSTDAHPQLESLGLDDTPSFGDPSSVRKLRLPFQPQPDGYVKLLGSCNGLVFLAFDHTLFHIWNPSSGFFKQLPDPGFSLRILVYYGVGYLSTTKDYKVLLSSFGKELEIGLFSLRTHSWQRIQYPFDSDTELDCQGILVNTTFHWLNYQDEDEIVCFDLLVEEFRKMRLPNFDNDGKSFSNVGVCGGCLCVSRYLEGACDSIDFWVLREYEVSDSWTMLFSLKLLDLPELYSYNREFLVVEMNTVVVANASDEGFELVKIDHNEAEKLGRYMLKGNQICMIEYEESLVWISGYHS